MTVFENRALKRIFGLKRDLMVESWRSLQNEKFNNLYFSPKIIRLMKSRRMSWADHVARVEEKMNEENALVGKLRVEEKRPRRRWNGVVNVVSIKKVKVYLLFINR
jgi:hypothetical protein